jgi:hypothetical protein
MLASKILTEASEKSVCCAYLLHLARRLNTFRFGHLDDFSFVIDGLQNVLDFLLNTLRFHYENDLHVELFARIHQSLQVVSTVGGEPIDNGAGGEGLSESRCDHWRDVLEVLFFIVRLNFFFSVLVNELMVLLEKAEVVVEFSVDCLSKLTYLFLVEIMGNHLAVRMEASNGGTILALKSTKNIPSHQRGGGRHDTSRNRPRGREVVRLQINVSQDGCPP